MFRDLNGNKSFPDHEAAEKLIDKFAKSLLMEICH
jgi:hypothetical protein